MTTTEMTAGTEFDPAKAEAFGGRLMGVLQGGLLSLMVDIGHRTGLFAAAAPGWADDQGRRHRLRPRAPDLSAGSRRLRRHQDAAAQRPGATGIHHRPT